MNTPISPNDIWALFGETDRKMRKTSEEIEKTSRLVKDVGEQIRRLGNKFGGFDDALSLPSMQKILGECFGVDTIFPSVRLTGEGQHLEIDVLAYAGALSGPDPRGSVQPTGAGGLPGAALRCARAPRPGRVDPPDHCQ